VLGANAEGEVAYASLKGLDCKLEDIFMSFMVKTFSKGQTIGHAAQTVLVFLSRYRRNC